jgi:hypothetical protein
MERSLLQFSRKVPLFVDSLHITFETIIFTVLIVAALKLQFSYLVVFVSDAVICFLTISCVADTVKNDLFYSVMLVWERGCQLIIES